MSFKKCKTVWFLFIVYLVWGIELVHTYNFRLYISFPSKRKKIIGFASFLPGFTKFQQELNLLIMKVISLNCIY